ncbi:DUF2550 family protein [Brachybacterium sp. MASK1Z-5]|uniref:DUF2550 family protein n=1 Tax=Brachybacterium halotolerans TaxID=2795215 RepID=A0ABS1B8R7_9MICO|nr:DUF2550 family protein [Brachybacterium halotolerans]MBK0330355.1 DUF2550 family protein [Brachybacterium halotolerans]
MMHVNVPITLVVIGTLVVLLALAVLVRSVVIARRGGALDCFLWRPRARGGRGAWRGGRLRFTSQGLLWHRTDALFPGGEVLLRRSEILDVQRQNVVGRGGAGDGAEGVVGASDAGAVTDAGGTSGPGGTRIVLDTEIEFVRREGEPLWLMLPFTTSSAVIAWYEAAPTGAVRGDAD